MPYSGTIWNYRHNWQFPVVERLAFSTFVLKHQDGSEQRRQIRLYPRRQLQYRCTVQDIDNERALALSKMRYAQNSIVLVPVWSDVSRLSTSITMGATSISLDTVGYDYDVGGYVFLRTPAGVFQAYQISAVTGTSITLTESTTQAFPVGTIVSPARLARAEFEFASRRPVSTVRDITAVFDIDPQSYSSNRFSTGTFQQYLSLDIFPLTHQGDDVQVSSPFGGRRVDFETGIYSIDSTFQSLPEESFQLRFILEGRQALAEYLRFVNNHSGRRVPFWYPTWDRDFSLISASVASSTITYKENGFASLGDFNGGRVDLAFLVRQDITTFNRGDVVLKRVTAAVNNGDGTETMTFSDLTFFVDADFTDAKIKIAFLRYARFDADVFELAWQNNHVATTNVSMRELVNSQ